MRARERLEVFGQTAAPPQPAERAFDDPTLLEHHKALCGIRARHDLELGPRRPAHRPGCLPALIGPVRDHPLQKGKEPPHRPQDTQAAVPILDVAGQNGAAEHQAERVNNGVALAPFDLLGRIIAHRIDRAPAPFGSFHALAVHDRGRGACVLAGQLTGLFVQGVVEPPQRAVTLPAHKVVVHGAARGQVFRQGAPLAARAQDVEHRVENLAQNNPALPPRPALWDINEGAGQVPFGVGHVRRLAVWSRALMVHSSPWNGRMRYGPSSAWERPHDGDKPRRAQFKRYPIGYFHIDIAELRTEQGKLYLLVAIDRTSKFAFVELHERVTRRVAGDFLRHLIAAVPYRVHTVLTDNGTHFTEPSGNTWTPDEIKDMLARKQLFRAHAFELACAQNDVAHRLTKPRHPWTNGQVERMNRTLKEATVQRFYYATHEQLRTHLADFVAAHNCARRLKTLRGLTPYEFICKRWTLEPERFRLDPLHQMPGLNS